MTYSMQFSQADEKDLLRRFEPVICFTRGERFFPMDVERYVHECSLWVQRPEEPAQILVPEGELTLEKLAQLHQAGVGAIYYLKFIEPFDLIQLARYSIREAVKTIRPHGTEQVFHAGRGRLARVGYVSRFIAALFSLSLLLRGRVPGDTAAAAAVTYQEMQTEQESYSYYGRVLRENGWIVLQYWFFYPFNNWRSGFFGVNDHEADWEMVTLFCSEDHTEDPDQKEIDRLRPRWAAYASHYFNGDDLRRRWDDPELAKVGEHPVIYAGAGSHASYFTAGDYLFELELSFLAPLVRLVDQLQDFWVKVLRQAGAEAHKPTFNVFRIPFVDYARGDGLCIGPQQAKEWQVRCISEATPWAKGYRGLWGLYAGDPVAGEDAPGGPLYNSDGSVRRSWYDPIGWAGLDKVAPPEKQMEILQQQLSALECRKEQLQETIADKSQALTGLGVQTAAMHGQPHLEKLYGENSEKIATLSEELSRLKRELTVEDATQDVLKEQIRTLESGGTGDPRSHLRHPLHPARDSNLRLSGLAEAFAAVSIGLMMIFVVALTVFARHYLVFGLSALIGFLIFVEAGFRRQLTQLVTSLVIGLAIVASFILLFEFFWEIIVALVLVAGLYIMWQNIREIRS